METEKILAERGKRYGAFGSHAEISQKLKAILLVRYSDSGPYSDTQKEALEMIAHKLARIVNGDPNYADSWQDIAGYAQLVVKELESYSPALKQVLGVPK